MFTWHLGMSASVFYTKLQPTFKPISDYPLDQAWGCLGKQAERKNNGLTVWLLGTWTHPSKSLFPGRPRIHED